MTLKFQKRWLRAGLLAALVALACIAVKPAYAVKPDEMLKDPKLEARARAISKGLRCMVCQNESIDDSNAPLAHDLRVLVRERLTKGDTDSQVINFLVARYGEFVLLKPRFELHTLLLWGMPPGVLIIGAIALFMLARRRTLPSRPHVPASGPEAKLSPEEEARLAELVGQGKG